jgi:hypothetical protein
MARRIIKEFSLDDISIVKEPAQEGARAVISKSMETDMEKVDEQGFANIVKAIELTYGCSPDAAHTSAETMLSDPEVAKKMLPRIAKHLGSANTLAKREASEDNFETIVKQIAKRDEVGRATAMVTARKEHPEAFAAYQEG